MLDELKNSFGLAALVVSLATTIYAWLTSRSRANSGHLEKVDTILSDQETRLSKLEGELAHLPDKAAINELEKAQLSLKGDIGVLSATLQPIAASVLRIEEFLINKAHNK